MNDTKDVLVQNEKEIYKQTLKSHQNVSYKIPTNVQKLVNLYSIKSKVVNKRHHTVQIIRKQNVVFVSLTIIEILVQVFGLLNLPALNDAPSVS